MLVSLERLTMNICYNRTETFELHIFCTLTYFKLQLYFLFFILFNKNLTFIFYSDKDMLHGGLLSPPTRTLLSRY